MDDIDLSEFSQFLEQSEVGEDQSPDDVKKEAKKEAKKETKGKTKKTAKRKSVQADDCKRLELRMSGRTYYALSLLSRLEGMSMNDYLNFLISRSFSKKKEEILSIVKSL